MDRRLHRSVCTCLAALLIGAGFGCASHDASRINTRYTPEEADVWTLVFRDLLRQHRVPRAYLAVDRADDDNYIDPPREVFSRLTDGGVVLERASTLNALPPLHQQPHEGDEPVRRERTTVYTARIVSWETAADGGGGAGGAGDRAPVARVEASYIDGPFGGGAYELLVRKTPEGWRATRTGKTWQY